MDDTVTCMHDMDAGHAGRDVLAGEYVAALVSPSPAPLLKCAVSRLAGMAKTLGGRKPRELDYLAPPLYRNTEEAADKVPMAQARIPRQQPNGSAGQVSDGFGDPLAGSKRHQRRIRLR